MALSREKNSVYTKLSIPLMGGYDKNWNDNSWIVEHLRHLADTIEDEQLKIMDIGIEMGVAYKIPNLYVKAFETRDSEKMNPPKFDITKIADYTGIISELRDVENLSEFTGRQELADKYGFTIQEVNWFIHKAMFGKLFFEGLLAILENGVIDEGKDNK